MHKSNKLLRWIRWSLLFVAIGYGWFQTTVFPYPEEDWDQAWTFGAAQSWLSGHGLTDAHVQLNDLSSPTYEHFVIKPFGLPLLYAATLSVMKDVDLANSGIYALAIVLFFLSWFRILAFLGSKISVKAQVVFWFLWAFCLDAIYMKGAAEEMVSLSLYSGALALCLKIISEKPRTHLTFLLGIFIGLIGATRYAYWSIVFVMPLSLIFYALVCDHQFRKQSLTLIVTVTIVFLAVLMSNKILEGHIHFHHLYRHDLSFSIKRLLTIQPFSLDSIGFTEGWLYLARGFDITSLELYTDRLPEGFLVRAGYLLGSFLVLLAWTLKTVSVFRRSFNTEMGSIDERRVFFVYAVGALTCLFTVAMICFLGVSYDFVVYLGQARYFQPVWPFIAFAFTHFLFDRNYPELSKAQTWLAPALYFILLVSFTNIYTRPLKIYRRVHEIGYLGRSQTDRARTEFVNLLQTVRHSYPLRFIEISSERKSPTRSLPALWAWRTGVPATTCAYQDFQLHTNNAVTLIVGVVEKDSDPAVAVVLKCLNNWDAKRIGIVDRTSYFVIDYLPDTPACKV